MSEGIEIIARGLCVKEGQLLLCHTKGKENTYLPGGHIEPGEKAAVALEREIAEEMGIESTSGKFLGAVEHSYFYNGRTHYEVNLLFELSIDLVPGKQPASMEDYIEFYWRDLKELDHAGLEPFPLRSLIPCWIDGERGRIDWASTYG